jgi:hypothetical protein
MPDLRGHRSPEAAVREDGDLHEVWRHGGHPDVNTARKGRRVEHRVRAVLEQQGYWVMRAAGSKGACDLIAKKPGMEALISIKSNGYPSQEELINLAAIPDSGNSVRWVIRWPDRADPVLRVVSLHGAELSSGEWLDYVRWRRAITVRRESVRRPARRSTPSPTPVSPG